MSDLKNAMGVAHSGLQAQSARMRIISQNIANADSVGTRPGADPYQRQTISFKNVMDKEMGVKKVVVDRYGNDPTPFPTIYQPGHPAADVDGYVKMPNLSPVIEQADLKEAQRAYEANLGVVDVSKRMLERTIDLLR